MRVFQDLVCPFAFAAAMLLAPTAALSDEKAALAAAEPVVTALEKAWNSGDAEAYVANYWPDAELINVFGSVSLGREEIKARVAEIFAGAFKGSQVHSTIRKVRRYAENLIVVDLDQDNTGVVRPGSPPGSARQPYQTRFKHILERRNGEWRIIASHNTRIVSAPF
jgi:uncharacterized protein (TIGR02246 family)